MEEAEYFTCSYAECEGLCESICVCVRECVFYVCALAFLMCVCVSVAVFLLVCVCVRACSEHLFL